MRLIELGLPPLGSWFSRERAGRRPACPVDHLRQDRSSRTVTIRIRADGRDWCMVAERVDGSLSAAASSGPVPR